MYSIGWHDSHKSYLIIGDRDSIYAVHWMLINRRQRHGERADIHAIHVHDVRTGLELDPERGLQAKVYLAAEDAGTIGKGPSAG